MLLDAIVTAVQEARQRLPRNGWDYFSSRFLHPEGITAFKEHRVTEVMFNFEGIYQQFERTDSLFAPDPSSEGDTFDISDCFPRFAVIDISASIRNGEFHLSFNFPKSTPQASRIKAWVNQFKRTLEDIAALPSRDSFYAHALNGVGVSLSADVEYIGPISPMQEAMLIAQDETAGSYCLCMAFEVTSVDGRLVKPQMLLAAWQAVVNRHAILRTIFKRSLSTKRAFDQIVLKSFAIQGISAHIAHEPFETVSLLLPQDFSEGRPCHELLVYKVRDGRVTCALYISHALMDSASMKAVWRDLGLAYAGALPIISSRPYSDLLSHIQSITQKGSLTYWNAYLSGSDECFLRFPRTDDLRGAFWHHSIEVSLENPRPLTSFSKRELISLSTVFRLAWALVLHEHVGVHDGVFGYVTASRDIALEHVHEIAGPFMNILPCRVQLGRLNTPVKELLEGIHSDFLNSMDHQFSSLIAGLPPRKEITPDSLSTISASRILEAVDMSRTSSSLSSVSSSRFTRSNSGPSLGSPASFIAAVSASKTRRPAPTVRHFNTAVNFRSHAVPDTATDGEGAVGLSTKLLGAADPYDVSSSCSPASLCKC